MSITMRPVTEVWGQDTACFCSSFTMEAIFYELGDFSTQDYGDYREVWTEKGAEFLNKLQAKTNDELYSELSVETWNNISVDDSNSLFDNMRALAPEWYTNLDPTDGSLTFYIDAD